jgi:RNA polymerase sigma-70 factor (ECF subfamily)
MRLSTVIDTPAAGAETSGQPREALERQFGRLLMANHAALSRLAASYASNVSDRDDLLQEIAIGIWRALPGFRGECSERTFLFRIAHNRCITHLSKRRPTVSLDDAQIDPVDPGASSETRVSEEQQRQRLVQAIHGLPVIHREVLTLFLEDMEYKEIAEIMGISESNVGVRLNRARQQLKALLEGQS